MRTMNANDQNSERVRFITSLAKRLHVSRQSINYWRRRPDAPQKQADGWDVLAWQDYMRRHNLHQNSMLPASEAASELAEALRSRLPAQIRRDELRRFCKFMLPVIPVFFGSHLPSAKPAV